MLFFVISGYCIAASVDSCQRKGLGFGSFMMRRVRRIYPPYLLSIAFWAATRYIKKVQTGASELSHYTAIDWVQNATLTQWVSMLSHPLPSAAGNKPLFVAAYWSLCYEEQFYLVMGLMMLIAAATGLSVLKMAAVLMGAGLACNLLYPEIVSGLFVEYWALFSAGVLVFHRLCRVKSPGVRRAIDAGLLALLVWAAYMRWFSGLSWRVDDPSLSVTARHEFRNAFGELAIGAAFALLLIAMRPLNGAISGGRWFRPLGWLGAITFSLYLIHQFNLNLISKIAGRFLHMVPVIGKVKDPAQTWYGLTLQIALHLALASVFWYFCEKPFLNRPLPSMAPKKP
jgi:peptidoglycan/LPS O-acetylase OafA/YrhL